MAFGVHWYLYIPGPKDLNDGPKDLNVLQPNGGYIQSWSFAPLGIGKTERVVPWTKVCLQ